MIVTLMVCGAAPDEECAPGRTCTEECLDRCKRLDVMVKPGQRIEEVCRRFSENGFLPPLHKGRQMYVYSLRQKAYVDPAQTFWQEKIYAGDILVIGEVCTD